jgi:hypothetical protein
MNNIFIKQNRKLTSEQLLSVVPEDNYKTSQEHLAKTKVEWRWRVFKFNNKTYVEISHKKYGENRLYLVPNECKWAERDIPASFDKYLEKVVYAYVD